MPSGCPPLSLSLSPLLVAVLCANCELLYVRRIRKVLVLRRPVLPCLQVEVLCALKLPTWLALSLQVPPLFLWLPGLGFRVATL